MTHFSGVPRKRLGECTEFVLDGTHGSPERTASGVPVLSAANVKDGRLSYDTDRFTSVEEYEAYRRRLSVRRGDVLLTIVGTIGRTAVVDELRPHVFQRSVAVLRPIQAVLDSRYLFHALNTREMAAQLASRTNQSAQGGVYLGALKELFVPAPGLPEQRRIADILDRADAIRRKRKEAIALTEELLRSAFLEMFGDPVTNPKGWEVRPLSALLASIDSGWSPVCEPRPARAGEWGVLKLGAVTFGRYSEQENKALSAELSPVPALEVQSGDVLFSRKNTYEHVAACVFVEATRDRLMLSDLIFRLVLSRTSGLLPEVLWGMMSDPRKRRQVQGLAAGTAGSMPNISKARLQGVQIPVPPPALQQRFAAALKDTARVRRELEAAAREAEALFGSLSDRAFRGAMTEGRGGPQQGTVGKGVQDVRT